MAGPTSVVWPSPASAGAGVGGAGEMIPAFLLKSDIMSNIPVICNKLIGLMKKQNNLDLTQQLKNIFVTHNKVEI